MKSTTEKRKKLNIKSVVNDIKLILKDSKDWWPADYALRTFFIRMTWHVAGTCG